MSVDEWCQKHDITKANYYYRLRKVREACLAIAEVNDVPSFVEVPVLLSKEFPVKQELSEVAGVLHGANGVRLELLNAASAEFIKNLVGAFANA